MSTLYTELQAAVVSVTTDAGLFRDITQGPATGAGSITTTENGDVWSLAKAVQYIINTGDTAIAAFNSDGAAAIAAFNANGNTALDDLQAAIDAISSDTDAALKSVTNVFTGANTFNGVTLVATAATTADTLNAVNVTMLRAFAAKKAANPTNALPGEAVDGADLRVNATGGIVVTSATGVDIVTPNTYDLTGAFDISWQMFIPTTEDFATIGSYVMLQDNYTTGVVVRFFDSGGGVIKALVGEAFAAGGPQVVSAAYTPPKGQWFAARLASSGGTGSDVVFSVNDNEVVRYTRNANLPASASLRFLGYSDGSSVVGRKIRLIRTANFEATADEGEGAAKGESRGRLAYRGQDDMPAAFSNSRFGLPGWDTFSTGANSVTFTSATVTSSCKADLPVQILAGQTLRTTVTVSGYTATTTPINLSAWDRTTTTDFAGFVPVTANGTYVLTSLASIASTQAQLCIVCDNPSGGGATFTVISSVVEGTVAVYAPENCTSLNRWLDNSGNDYHLLPVGGAKALNPQVPHWRDFVGRFNLATLAEETPEGVIATRQTNPGILRLVFASYMLLSGKRVKAAVSAGLETGQLISLNSVTAPTYIDVHVRKTTDGTYINDEVTYAGAHFE